MIVAGCGGDALSPRVDGAEPFDPPDTYGILWTEVETCSGLTGSMSLVSWYVVPRTTTFPCEYGQCAGLWEAPHDIYLSDAAAHDHAGIESFDLGAHVLADAAGEPSARRRDLPLGSDPDAGVGPREHVEPPQTCAVNAGEHRDLHILEQQR